MDIMNNTNNSPNVKPKIPLEKYIIFKYILDMIHQLLMID